MLPRGASTRRKGKRGKNGRAWGSRYKGGWRDSESTEKKGGGHRKKKTGKASWVAVSPSASGDVGRAPSKREEARETIFDVGPRINTSHTAYSQGTLRTDQGIITSG